MTRLNDALIGVTQLGFDTPPIIYFVQAHPRYGSLANAVFQRLGGGALQAVTSVITVTEVLAYPLRQGDMLLHQQYEAVLYGTEGFRTEPISTHDAESAADLRARYKLRTPDALQIAVALREGCEAFLTNDTALSRVTELRVLVLDELTL